MKEIEYASRGNGSRACPSEATPLYPSYVDLDPFLDIHRLKALDGLLLDGIRRRIDEPRDLKFCTGPFVLDPTISRIPGPQMVYLSRTTVPDDYYLLDQPWCWERTEAAQEFAPLMDFIATLPFKATARMLIIYDQAGRAVPAHRDHDDVDLCHEFIWFRTNLDKPFYMLDPITDNKRYVHSHAAWFDTVNQYHGADGNGRLSISIRVDGIFSDDFRQRIPFTNENRASTPARWAHEMAHR